MNVNLKLTTNNTFHNAFCKRIFLYYRFLLIIKKWMEIHKLWLVFTARIFFTTLLFQILKRQFTVTEIVAKMFWKESFI